MATQILYASGLVCDIVCGECQDKPCPYRNMQAKNACHKLIEYNEKLGKCCATCIHLVSNIYCGEKARGKKITPSADFQKFVIEEDIFKHSCSDWTNLYDK